MSEPLKATFFVLKPRDRMVLLPATLVFVAIIAALLGAFAALNWSTLLHFRDLFAQSAAGGVMSEAEVGHFVGRVFGVFGAAMLLLFPFYIAVAAYEAACLRWMIRGEAPGLFGITIDNDAWRVWGIYWVWLLVNFAVSIAVSIVTMPLMFMTMGEIMRNPTQEAMMDWQMRVQLPLTFLQNIPLIFLSIRFGPAAATSVALEHFSFFTAWKVTSGRFWALFGSHFLLWLGISVVMALMVGGLYAVLLPDFVAHLLANWRTMTPQDAMVLIMTPRGFTIIGISYATYFVLFALYAIFAFGINARATLAALDEGKIEKGVPAI